MCLCSYWSPSRSFSSLIGKMSLLCVTCQYSYNLVLVFLNPAEKDTRRLLLLKHRLVEDDALKYGVWMFKVNISSLITLSNVELFFSRSSCLYLHEDLYLNLPRVML